jgi:hypothetical protein
LNPTEYKHDPMQVYPLGCPALRESGKASMYDVNWTIYADDMFREATAASYSDGAARGTTETRLSQLDPIFRSGRRDSDPIGMLTILNALNILDSNDANVRARSRFVMLCLINPLSQNGAQDSTLTLRFAHEAAGNDPIRYKRLKSDSHKTTDEDEIRKAKWDTICRN